MHFIDSSRLFNNGCFSSIKSAHQLIRIANSLTYDREAHSATDLFSRYPFNFNPSLVSPSPQWSREIKWRFSNTITLANWLSFDSHHRLGEANKRRCLNGLDPAWSLWEFRALDGPKISVEPSRWTHKRLRLCWKLINHNFGSFHWPKSVR